jgi:hypothetical protein
MSATLAITLYLGLALALALLRLLQSHTLMEAGMAGLLWPVELLCTGIDAAAQLALPAAEGSERY